MSKAPKTASSEASRSATALCELGAAVGSAASPARKLHLITVAKVWHRRAVQYAVAGSLTEAAQATRKLEEALTILETLCR